ncbi:MAG: hypothetical protein JSR59_25835 [Proteobacteria bacterium]|nr:hypothetical protein [Pseudomonadota bacterium]
MKPPLLASIGIAVLLAACGGSGDDHPAAGSARADALQGGSPTNDSALTSPSRAAVASAGVRPLEERVARLEGALAAIRREVSDLQARAQKDPHQAESAGDPRSDPAARAEAEGVERTRMSAAESAFRAERDDPASSRSALDSVRQAFAGADEALRGGVRSIECRSSSCRIEIGGVDGPATGLPELIGRLAPTWPRVAGGTSDLGDGQRTTVLYLTR